MSIYERRSISAYRASPVNSGYCRNPFILSWWSKEHDALIENLISQWRWVWYWHAADEVKRITPMETIENWKKADPICRNYAWYNVIMYFAQARAQFLGLTEKISQPQIKTCPLCNHEFVEDSLPLPLISRLGIDCLDFCAPCLKSIVFQGTGNPSYSKEQILSYLRSLTNTLQQIPHQGFGEGIDDLIFVTREDRLSLMRILKNKPTVSRVKQIFGSWLNALVEASVLEGDIRKTSRGTQCIAKDGHICYSLAEKTIDDYLYNHAITHEKEPKYPGSNLRADFLINSVFIEYFGLKGDPPYDVKIGTKQKLCADAGIVLISLFSDDIVSVNKLEKKLFSVLSRTD